MLSQPPLQKPLPSFLSLKIWILWTFSYMWSHEAYSCMWILKLREIFSRIIHIAEFISTLFHLLHNDILPCEHSMLFHQLILIWVMQSCWLLRTMLLWTMCPVFWCVCSHNVSFFLAVCLGELWLDHTVKIYFTLNFPRVNAEFYILNNKDQQFQF